MGNIEDVKKLIDDGAFEAENLPVFLGALQELAGDSEDLEDELEDTEDVKIQFDVIDTIKAWIKIEDHKLTAGEGEVDDPDVTLQMDEATGRGMFTGETDAASAYMQGDLKIVGEMAKAMKLRALIEIVAEELDIEFE
ncbi:MAG: SCP2 sterol-binding domain-containing protein [Promethearchaeota archaeon]|nr:MAG: SCP2 sterol-binding domain-containing protein [Candidatus Lokiarchaeota archaeon]